MINGEADCMCMGSGRQAIGIGGAARWVSVLPMLAMLVALSAMLTRSATAQGNLPLMPDPITTQHLKGYEDLLGLSDQQRLATFDLHDVHIEQYRQLQQRDVRKLMDRVIAIGMRFMANQFEIPTRDEVDAIVSGYRRVLNKANRLDTEFFSSLTPLLSEEQIQMLPRVRRRREMHLYEELVVEAVEELNRGASVDLAEIIEELELTPEERDTTAIIVDLYESARLREMRDGIDLMERLVKLVLDAVDELGLRTMTPEQMMQLGQDPAFINDVQTRFNELSKPFQAAAYEASQHNLATYRQLVPLLSAKHAWELRDQYYRKAYRRVYDGPGDWRRSYNEAIHLAEATEKQLTALRTQKAHYDRADAQLVDAMVDDLEKSRRFRTAARFEGSGPDPIEDEITEYQQRRESLHAGALSTLVALLGNEMAGQIDNRLRDQQEQQRVRQGSQVVLNAGSGDVNVSMMFGSYQRTSPDEAFRPYAMTASEMKMFEQFLGAKQAQADVATVVYDAYRERYDRLRGIQTDTEQGGDTQQNADPVTPTRQLRAEQGVFDSLAAADADFFDDLQMVYDADIFAHLGWIRQFRTRLGKTRLSRGLNPTWGDDEAYVDLAAIIMQHTSVEQLPAAMDGIMAQYHQQVMPLIDARARAAAEVHRHRLTFDRMRQSSDAPGNLMQSVQQKMQESSQKIWQTNRSIQDVNRQALERLMNVLDEDTGWQVRWAYNQAAYPDIFDERSSAQRYFDAALDLADLDQTQRQRIGELMMSYRQKYFAASEEMVELRQGRSVDLANFQMPRQEDIDRELRLEQLRFDRREAANRAKYQLQLVLRDDQTDRIADLRLLR